MTDPGDQRRENVALRERISTLTAAILRISATLDLDTVLAEVVASARGLTGARYGVIVTVDEAGAPQDFWSGTPAEWGVISHLGEIDIDRTGEGMQEAGNEEPLTASRPSAARQGVRGEDPLHQGDLPGQALLLVDLLEKPADVALLVARRRGDLAHRRRPVTAA